MLNILDPIFVDIRNSTDIGSDLLKTLLTKSNNTITIVDILFLPNVITIT